GFVECLESERINEVQQQAAATTSCATTPKIYRLLTSQVCTYPTTTGLLKCVTAELKLTSNKSQVSQFGNLCKIRGKTRRASPESPSQRQNWQVCLSLPRSAGSTGRGGHKASHEGFCLVGVMHPGGVQSGSDSLAVPALHRRDQRQLGEPRHRAE
ncbi:hypothetical protein pipiens_019697, partial [Culex pipiens pipiens]